MSYTPGYWTCDICGDEVDEREMVTLQTTLSLLAQRARRPDYEPGYLAHYHCDCWLQVRAAVREAAVPDPDGPDADDQAADENKPDEYTWSDLPIPAREHLVYGVLDGKKLTIRGITENLNALLPEQPKRRNCRGEVYTPAAVWDSQVRSIVSRMFKEGQLAREPEIFQKTKTRYRYFLPPLEGTIAELERALADSQSEAA